MDLKTKKNTLYLIGLINFISAWCLTIGYFTPQWIYATQLDWSVITLQHDPCTIGLIYAWCGHNYTMNNALIMMSVGLVIKYLTVAMMALGIFFDLWKYAMFMTMLSIVCGTLYPAAAIIILFATIYVEVYFLYQGHTVGYSAILCTLAGALMLIVFIYLVLYDHLYVSERTQTSKKQMNASTLKNANTAIDSIHNGQSDSGAILETIQTRKRRSQDFKKGVRTMEV